MKYNINGNPFFNKIVIFEGLGEIRFYFLHPMRKNNIEEFYKTHDAVDKALNPQNPQIGFSRSTQNYYEVFGMTELGHSAYGIEVILALAYTNKLIAGNVYKLIRKDLTKTINNLKQKEQDSKQFQEITQALLSKMKSLNSSYKEIKKSSDLKEFSYQFVVFQSKFPQYFGDFIHPQDADARFAFIMPIETFDASKNFGIFLFTRSHNQTLKSTLIPSTIEQSKFKMRAATDDEINYLKEAHHFDQAVLEMHTTKSTVGLVEDLARLSLSKPEFQAQPLLTQFYQKMNIHQDNAELKSPVSRSTCTII